MDILADLEVDTHVQLSPERLIYRMFAALLPSRCVVVVLQRNLELVKSARVENRLDRNLSRRSDLYERHRKAAFARTVCNDAQPVVVARRILRLAGLCSPRCMT